MKCFSFIRGAAIALAAAGMLIPQVPTMASGPATRPTIKTVDAKIFDIALSNGGTFRGRVVDHTGAAMEGAAVTVKQNNKEVARSITDKSGSFAVGNLKSGIYTVGSGATEGTYRVWAEKSAPPTAKEQGLLVMGQNGARGNFGYFDGYGNYIVAGIAIAALTVAIIALKEAQENENARPHSP